MIRLNGRWLAVIAACGMAGSAWGHDVVSKKTLDTPTQSVVAEVEVCIKKLGADSFRTRRQATKRLLELGNFTQPMGKNLRAPNKEYICQKMDALLSNDDPEVSQRARKIYDMLKMHPKVVLKGFVQLPHFVDPDQDTLEIIAETYGSTVEWIKTANPKIKNTADLRAVKEVSVPVEELSVK